MVMVMMMIMTAKTMRMIKILKASGTLLWTFVHCYFGVYWYMVRGFLSDITTANVML